MSWQARAACRDADPALFFSPEGERGVGKEKRAAAAKAVCARCPVVAECDGHARDRREPYGVWGGVTEDERAELALAARRAHRKAREAAAPLPPRQDHLPIAETQIRILAALDRGWTRSRIAACSMVAFDTIENLAAGRSRWVSVATAKKIKDAAEWLDHPPADAADPETRELREARAERDALLTGQAVSA